MMSKIFFCNKWHFCKISRNVERPLVVPGPLGVESYENLNGTYNVKISLPVDGVFLDIGQYEVSLDGVSYTFLLERPYGAEALGVLVKKLNK